MVIVKAQRHLSFFVKGHIWLELTLYFPAHAGCGANTQNVV